jgi:hypothetical protein
MEWNKDIEIVDKEGRRTTVTLGEIEMRLLMYLTRKELEILLKGMGSTL